MATRTNTPKHAPGRSKQSTRHKQFKRWIWLDQQIRAGRAPTIRALRDKFGISERTAHRDIDDLKDRFGAPIEYSYDKRGYIYTKPDYKIDFRALGLYLLRLIPACGLPLIPAVLISRVIPRNLEFTLPYWNVEVTTLNVAVPLVTAGFVYGVGLLALCCLFRLEETMLVLGRILHRGKKRSA